MFTVRSLCVVIASIALLPLALHAQQQGLDYVLTDAGWEAVTPLASVDVDAVLNAAPMNGAPGCGGQWAMLFPNDYPSEEGKYAIAISGGPGISLGGDSDMGCFVMISGNSLYLGGLHGMGSIENPRSFIPLRVLPGETRQVHLCVADGDCLDNDGYVEVTLYRIGN